MWQRSLRLGSCKLRIAKSVEKLVGIPCPWLRKFCIQMSAISCDLMYCLIYANIALPSNAILVLYDVIRNSKWVVVVGLSASVWIRVYHTPYYYDQLSKALFFFSALIRSFSVASARHFMPYLLVSSNIGVVARPISARMVYAQPFPTPSDIGPMTDANTAPSSQRTRLTAAVTVAPLPGYVSTSRTLRIWYTAERVHARTIRIMIGPETCSCLSTIQP